MRYYFLYILFLFWLQAHIPGSAIQYQITRWGIIPVSIDIPDPDPGPSYKQDNM